MKNQKPLFIVIAAVAVVFIFILMNPFIFVPVGYRGIGLRLGGVTGRVYSEGMNFRVPLIEGSKIIEIRVQKEQVAVSAASRDLQSVSSVIAVNFALKEDKVINLYQSVGENYKERLISPAIQESVKSVTARFTAEELITKRADVSDQILQELRSRLGEYGLQITDLNIVDFDFSPSFNQAIEQKVTAEQDALAAKNKLERVKFEADQAVEEAKGKAEAQRVEGEALKANPAVIELRAIEKWDGQLPTYMTGTNTPFVKIQ